MSRPAASRGFDAFLLLTVVVCGALVMVIEVMGSRVIGPFFGVSLFVWTSLITVTLVALAAGYAVGGWLADRRPSPDALYLSIALAGVLTLLVPWLKAPVLKAFLPLGLRGGALASSALLFGPSLFLLGFVSPYVVRLAAREMEGLGKTVGALYALSTLGSFAGTVAAGFYLVAVMRVGQIFLLTGALLVALGAAWFLLFRRKAAGALLLLPLLAAPFLQPAPARAWTAPGGTRVTLVEDRDGRYGNLKVVDYAFPDGSVTRELMIDGLVQGGQDRMFGISAYAYPYLLQALPVLMAPGGDACLSIGLGAGLVPSWYQGKGFRTEVVEIDPAVVAMARRYFGFRVPEGDVFVEDARAFVNRAGRRYDFVILDVFNGDLTPGHVLSLEAFTAIRGVLEPGGVLAMNIIGSMEEDPFTLASLGLTLGKVFETVEMFPLYEPSAEASRGNVVVVAHDGPSRPVSLAALGDFPIHPRSEGRVRRALERRSPPPRHPRAVVLTDDFNPLDVVEAGLREQVRRDLLAGTDRDLLARP